MEIKVKSHGSMEGVYINGAPQGITFHETDEYTLYPASIISVNKNRYTKHYFIGSKRIASRIGSGHFNNVYGMNGCNITAGQQDYAERLNQIESQKEDYYRELGIAPGVPTMKGSYGDPENTGVGYNTIIRNLGDHSVPAEWAEYVKKNDKKETAPGAPIAWEKASQPEEVQPGYGFIPDNESTEETFYYHSDHLGSTSYVTDDSARITQYTAYLPYGELLVDEHTSSEDLPYKFNGKELDEETGLYYYSARYMNPVTSVWYIVDPLTEKYTNVSGYVYCAGNPIIRIDTDGRDSYLIVWASQSDAYGHAAFAVDNYSWDAKQKTYLPNGTMTVYGLFPQEAYGANQAVSDERVQALFLIDKHATIEKIKTNKFNSGEISNPDGILKISTNYETDSQTKKVLQKEISSNKGYKGMSRNCSTFARVGVQNATRKDVKGTENCLFYNYVTPNSLFKETKELNNTTVIVDLGDKIDYKFITNINVSVKNAIK